MTTTTSAAAGLPARIKAASRRPASLGATPTGAVSLAMGEPFTGTDERVAAAAIESIRAGNTRYSPLTGHPALREAIAERLSSRHARAVSAPEVVPTHGASAALAATVLALVGPGDRVVIPEPTYSLYADHVAMAGGEVVWVPNRPDGSLDLEMLLPALAGARMVILCNPGNPTGRLFSRQELVAVGAAAADAGAWLVSDEAYNDVVFDGVEYFSSLDQPEVGDNIICCGTFSKSYAMTGWRLGYVVAPQVVADQISLVHRTFNGALNSFVQVAGITALSLDDALLCDLSASYQQRRDLVVARLATVPSVELAPPQGAFYAFPKVRMRISSDELTDRMARAGVIVRSGREYGPSGEGHFRISFATDLDSLALGLSRVISVLEGDLS